MIKENKNTPEIRFPGFTEDWEQRKLQDMIEVCSGRDYKHLEEGDIPVYGTGGYMLSVSEALSDEQDAIGIGRKGTIDKPFILKAPFWTVDTLFYCVPRKDYDLSFVFDIFQNINWKAMDESTGVPSLSKAVINKVETLAPNYEEQKKIGGYFSKLDTLITLHQRKYDTLQTLKKSMLQKMFPKKGSSVPEIRFPSFTEDWEQRKLGDVIIEYKETVDADCDLPVLTSSKTEGVILQEEHFGRKQNHDITGYNILPQNYCTYRNRSDGVDFTFNINKCCEKGIISKFYPVFYGKDSDIFFVSLVLNNSDEVIREIGYTCTGTGQKVLSFLDLQKMNIRVPAYEEQKKIAAYFEKVDHLITLHQRKCDTLKELKKGMLQKMFV